MELDPLQMESEVAKLINNALEAELSAGQMGRLSGYIYDQLDALNGHLDVEIFERVLHIVHQRILQRFHDIVLVDVDKKRQPATFRQWQQLWTSSTAVSTVPPMPLMGRTRENRTISFLTGSVDC